MAPADSGSINPSSIQDGNRPESMSHDYKLVLTKSYPNKHVASPTKKLVGISFYSLFHCKKVTYGYALYSDIFLLSRTCKKWRISCGIWKLTSAKVLPREIHINCAMAGGDLPPLFPHKVEQWCNMNSYLHFSTKLPTNSIVWSSIIQKINSRLQFGYPLYLYT